MENKLKKIDEVENYLREQTRFYINTEEKLAEALLFAKKLKSFAEEVEGKIKERGKELMDKHDTKEINVDGWRVVRIDPTQIDEFNVSSLFKAVEPVVAMALVKVDNTKLKNWIKKSKLEGEILAKINEGKRIKLRSGYIKIMEIKEKEDKIIYIK